MIWIVLSLIIVISLVTVSLVFGSSTYSSMPGAKNDGKVVKEEELLMPNCDENKYAMIDNKHKEVAKLVAKANDSYSPQPDLKATSDALLKAVECYEDIREQAESAVVELNLAILTKARIIVERELNDDQAFITELQEYINNAQHWAGWLLNEEPARYSREVTDRYKKLKAA